MPLRGPRISSASAQHLRRELDVLEAAASQQHWRSLRFESVAMEQRFQLEQHEAAQTGSRWRGLTTLLPVLALQAAVFYDRLVLQNATDAVYTVLYVAIGGNVLLLGLWLGFYVKTKRGWISTPSFQLLLFVLGVSLLQLILVLGLYETPAAEEGLALLEEERRAHAVTRTLLFLLLLLGVVATAWHTQFLAYCAVASCTVVALLGWLLGCSDDLRRHWHLLLLCLGDLLLLGRTLYCQEQELRHKFLHVRHMQLENLKLTRQNAVMQQQLSCHVDAVGIGLSRDEPRASSPTARSQTLRQQRKSFSAPQKVQPRVQTQSESPAIGESWMENVLRSLCQLRQQLEGDEQATDELDFVLQTLTSEHDLFLDTWSRQRRVPTSSATTERAETGWLSLLEERRYRRRRTDPKQQQQLVQSPLTLLTKSLRGKASGSRVTVLTLIETYLPPGHDKTWTPDELLARAATSEELELFAFAEICTFPLTTLLLATLESHRLFANLTLRVESVAAFMLEIEARYQPKNPYHNALHAASVVWDVNFFLRRLEAPRLTPVQLFSALVAAAVHDVNHPGVNNAFLVATTAPLAIKYSDDSVLERMHLAEAFQACTKDGCDIFEGFSRELRRQSRQQIIAMVLATDLSGHLTHVSRLKSKLYAPDGCCAGPGDVESVADAAAAVLLLPDELVLQTLLMMADVGHAMKSFPLHVAWSERVTEEFFRQGDTERQFDLPISPLCDRSTGATHLAKSQIGFLQFVVLPLYGAARDVLPLRGFDEVLARVRQNATVWDQQAAAESPTNGEGRSPPTIKEELSRETEEIVVDVAVDGDDARHQGTVGET
ncbi:hypothetical protein BBJ28_00012943 [Nothophytophthora sp. Chile5]|nr:hypothetical protein BBJ28_00012943 [Nothophytophthora sp. Chile5]